MKHVPPAILLWAPIVTTEHFTYVDYEAIRPTEAEAQRDYTPPKYVNSTVEFEVVRVEVAGVKVTKAKPRAMKRTVKKSAVKVPRLKIVGKLKVSK